MFALHLRVPIVLAPMAGGISTPELVAAVSDAGGLGSLGAAYLSPAQLREAGAAVRRLTREAFAVNLFAPQPTVAVTATQVERAAAELAPFHAGLGLPPPTLLPEADHFEGQFDAVLELRPAVLSFTFGRLEAQHLEALKEQNILAIGTATGLEEARQLEADGVDAIVVQGGAAGGHRGGWLADELADTLALTRAAARSVRVPLIAAGGLMGREDVRAALDAGASLAQCGTAFLRATEAGTSGPYRAALAAAKTGDTVLTRAFSGRTARGLGNAVTDGVQHPLPYPFQNALTRQMRAAGVGAGRADVLSLWAGEGVARGQDGTAAELLAGLWP